MKQLQIPPLAEGEIYIGAIGDTAGDVHHVILLPGDNCSQYDEHKSGELRARAVRRLPI